MRIHVVGIGGTGMSAIARLLVAEGHDLSGSDSGRWPLSDALVPLGVRVHDTFAAEHVGGAEVVLRSSAYGDQHAEVAAGRAAGARIWRRHEAWAHLARGKRVLAVAGTHGKTTTTALAWSALRGAGIDASLVCGAPLRDLGSNAHAGSADVLVIEADEYDRTFLALEPAVAIVTNVEHDHVDQFPTRAEYFDAFHAFAARAQTLVPCVDDAGAAAIAGGAAGRMVTYGEEPAASAVISRVEPKAGGSRFALRLRSGEQEVSIATRLPGMHNVRNAAGAVVAATLLGAEPAQAAHGIASCPGPARRLETLGTAGGVTVVDDYAHHPTELRASLEAMRPRTAGRLIALFQPHTPSRTTAFADGFAAALRLADLRLVAATFASAREADDAGAGARDLARKAGAAYVAGPDEAAAALAALVAPGDLVLVMGAGDIRRAGERLLALLALGSA